MQLALRVPGWLARLPPPWGPVPPEDVGDLAQEVLTAAVASLPRYDPAKGSMAVWLYAIMQRMGARPVQARTVSWRVFR